MARPAAVAADPGAFAFGLDTLIAGLDRLHTPLPAANGVRA